MDLYCRKNAIFGGFENVFQSKIIVTKLNDNADSL